VSTPRAVIFDLGGTLVHWADWENGAVVKWAASYEYLIAQFADRRWPARDAYVTAMREAEGEHWRRVDSEHWSGPPTGVVREGFDRLGIPVSGAELVAAMDGYAKAIAGWSTVDVDAAPTLTLLRQRGYHLGLLSNTWWAADWHNADLATHGLAAFIDALVYTSDLPHSKPHRAVFEEIARRLDVAPEECVMVGDRMVDDVSGALALGMRAVWRKNSSGFPTSTAVPTAEIDGLAELPGLLRKWGGA
jgi:HAD superfamily hydrolase (TIGR01549 family)